MREILRQGIRNADSGTRERVYWGIMYASLPMRRRFVISIMPECNTVLVQGRFLVSIVSLRSSRM